MYVVYLHGGPGSPEFPILYEMILKKECNFNLIHIEQYGSGLSFDKFKYLSIAEQIELIRKLISMIIDEYNISKVILMGHSFGSLLGIKLAHDFPKLFYCYIGISQISNQFESEKLAIKQLKLIAYEKNDTNLLKKFNKCKIDNPLDITNKVLNMRSVELNKNGFGVIYGKNDNLVMTTILKSPCYSFLEKIKYFLGMMYQAYNFSATVCQFDLSKDYNTFEIPIYFLSGEFDFHVNCNLSKQYLDEITAPKKAYYEFENATHFPHVEDVEKFFKLIDLITLEYKKGNNKNK